MPVEHRVIDTVQTKISQSFVNLTKQNSTTYPAVSVIKIAQYDMSNAFLEAGTVTDPLTTVNVYDQWALRVFTAA
jgi:hypothetical protein